MPSTVPPPKINERMSTLKREHSLKKTLKSSEPTPMNFQGAKLLVSFQWGKTVTVSGYGYGTRSFWNPQDRPDNFAVHPMTHRIGSMGRTVYLPTWKPWKNEQNVGTYTSPMDPMGEALQGVDFGGLLNKNKKMWNPKLMLCRWVVPCQGHMFTNQISQGK